VWRSFIGLGGAGSSAILPRACCGGHVGWLWLGLWDGVKCWVLCALGDGGEGLSEWGMGLVLIRCLGGAIVWMEMLAKSSRWHHQGCLWA
jgi:hypothetical protein